MKARWALLLFAAGVASGWVLRPDGLAKHMVEASRGPRATMSRQRLPQEDGRASFGKRIAGAESSGAMRIWKDLDRSERMEAMESMASAARIGDEKFQNRLGSMVHSLLKGWMDSDPEGLLAMVRSTSNQDLKDYLLRRILEHLQEKKDVEQALALEIEFLQEGGHFRTDVPRFALEAKLGEGAAAYLELMEKLPFMPGGGGGTPGRFPADFNFQQVADGVSDLIQARGGLKPPNFPLDFHTEWARRDRDAAYAWWANHPPLPYNDLNQILAVTDEVSPGSSTTWIAAKLQDPDAPRDKIILGLGSGEERAVPGRVDAVAKAMPDTGSADALLTDFIVLNSTLDPRLRHSPAFALSSLSSPQARLDAVITLGKRGGSLPLDQFTDDQFKAWGTTREEMTNAFARSGNH